MKAHTGALLMLAACLAAAPTRSRHLDEGWPQITAEVQVHPDPPDGRHPCSMVHSTLLGGGRLYAGTVLSATVLRSEGGGDALEPLSQVGTLHFRVDKTLLGPPVRELNLRWWWQAEPDENHNFWVGSDPPIVGPWHGPGPPRAGQHLLLLLKSEESAKRSHVYWLDPVRYVWRVPEIDHPLVRGFQDAAKFLQTKDVKKQDRLFPNLCNSPFPSLRAFAKYAAYSPDPARKKQRWLQYLRLAAPLIKGEEEKAHFILSFTNWLEGQPDWPQDIPEVALAAFAEFCWEDLRFQVDPGKGWFNPSYCDWALEGLEVLLHKRGTAWTLALFQKHGRAALQQRLRSLVQAIEAERQRHHMAPADNREVYKRVSTLLGLKYEPRWPQGIPEAALPGFADFCWEELEAREPHGTLDSFRCLEALNWLERLLHQRGVAGTLPLFHKAGRLTLQERLRSVAQSAEAESQAGIAGSADIRKASKRVLALLGQR